MNEQETFIRADEALQRVIEQIPADRLDEQVPAEFPTANDQSFTLREMLTYQAYDEAWIPDMMAGRTVDEVGAETYGAPLENDLLGDDPKTGYGELLTRAVAAVRAIDDADLDGRTVHYSYGDYPVREALWHAIIFRATRAYDIARMIGAETRLADDLVASVWAIVEPHAEEWREMGVFGPRFDVPESAPLQDRLLGLTGRTPA